MLNLNHLHYFFVCAQYKSVTRAAEYLRISQPSLSQQLKIFEAEIGARLFIRTGRSFELSARGKVLYEKSKGLFEIAESISQTANMSLKETSVFRIGVSNDIDRPFVAEMVGKLLRTRHARTNRFEIISKSHQEIQADFASEQLDLAISNSSFRKLRPFHESNFPVYLVTSSKLNKFRHIDEKNLPAIFDGLGEGLIVASGDLVLREQTNRFLKQISFSPEISFESNILACMSRAAREKIGCVFLPLPYIYEDYQRGALNIIGPKGGYWQHRVLFYSKSKVESALKRSLIQVVSEYLI